MKTCILWKCLYTPGHDAALLTPQGEGWLLRGNAVFLHEEGPASVDYRVGLDETWQSCSGHISGFLGDRPLDISIVRQADGWVLNGRRVAGLNHLVDLDFGFTPATNMQQLRRAKLAIGEGADLPAAWFDLGAETLIELPQRYERRSDDKYWYASPTANYEGMLEIAPNGFAQTYPGLWQMLG